VTPVDPGERLRLHAAPAGLVDRAISRKRRSAIFRQLALPLAMAATFAGGVLVGDALPEDPAAEETVAVRLMYHDEAARSVSVAGSWTGWNPEPMTRMPDGTYVWEQTLPHGAHEYMFLVDGQWVTDPTARVVRDDGFGNRNAVLEI
jgi:hypothetical protein